MKKILFLIHDLGAGGAEKVLVNLVNHMDQSKFDITIVALFDGGVNEQFLLPHIRYRSVWKKPFPGNSKFLKLFTPKQLHRICIKERYDIEISYLEGPSARIVSGCDERGTKLINWIHIEQKTGADAAAAFRSYRESRRCYERFDQTVCVSESVKQDFLGIYPGIKNVLVRYNTMDSDRILSKKNEPVVDVQFRSDEIKLVAVGKISKRKGFDRLARIVKRLRDEELPVHLYALGEGIDRKEIELFLRENLLEDYYTFLGYQINPYKYIEKCDLFVCASMAEGFSTAAAESLILGIPVCTVDVSGMQEMLGSNNEWGVITENNEDALYDGIRKLISAPMLLQEYKRKAADRGVVFSNDETVKAVESLLLES